MTGGHGMDPITLPEARQAKYSLKGNFLEVCDCFTICPCWTGRAPDEGSCTGVFGWMIETGRIDGVDVSKRKVVSISTHEGHRENAHQKVMIFVDAKASDREVDVLAAAFAGLLGGPLGELAVILGEILSVERMPIEITSEGRRSHMTVGRTIEADTYVLVGATGQNTTLSQARLSVVLGDPAEVGVASRLKVGMPGQGIDFDLRGRSAIRGSFHYQHDPKKPA